LKKIFLYLSFLLVSIDAMSFHIVGGGITYECIGGGNYKITMRVYRDCYCTDCADLDDPAMLFAFSGTGASYGTRDIGLSGPFAIPPFVNNPCLQNPPNVCVEEGDYIFTWDFGTIPSSGIYVVYQRCCRNSTIVNLFQPDTQGSTYFAFIPPPSIVTCNNSPTFDNFPPIAICGDDPLVFDHGATDSNGDSLVYVLCNPYIGLSQATPDAGSAGGIEPPPYNTVDWLGAFNANNPMNGTNPLTINPNTGIITGFGFATGQYVVGVCVREYRDGVYLSTTSRDFQFNVTQCNPIVVAALPDDFRECESYTINFTNYSSGGTSYLWDFGDSFSFNDTSTIFQPIYTYADTGLYYATLIVNPNKPCTDTAVSSIYIYPGFTADFIADSGCPYDDISFDNLSTITYGTIDSIRWDFFEGSTLPGFDAVYAYTYGGVKNIRLQIWSDKGCYDEITKQLYVYENPDLNAGLDLAIYLGDMAFLGATGATNYQWSAPEVGNFSTIANPVVQPTVNTTYTVSTVSSYGCFIIDTINVVVRERPIFIAPTGFSPNGDGMNDLFFATLINAKSFLKLSVYNRWGELLFTTNDINKGWDGTYKGSPQEIGTYVFYAEAEGINGETLFNKGNITLLR
jgi:gliding motility-associated-like protein